jgi:hypothetical protein
MQSIFSAASRRETAGKPFEGWSPRRWAKNRLDENAAIAWLMGIVCRLDLGRGPEAVRDGQRAGLPR